MYKSIHFATDGNFVTDNERETVEEVWQAVNDMGSRWFFYPIPCVIKSGANLKRGRIISPCAGFDFLQNKSIKTAQKYIKNEDDDLLVDNEGNLA